MHTTNRATPTQLVFDRDAMLNISFEADWQCIKERKQHRVLRTKTPNAKPMPIIPEMRQWSKLTPAVSLKANGSQVPTQSPKCVTMVLHSSHRPLMVEQSCGHGAFAS